MKLLQTNLRTRLTVLYASLLGVALLLYACVVSIFFLHKLQEQLDSSLHRDVETVEGALSADRNGGLQISSREGEADEDDLDRGYLLEVWSADRKLSSLPFVQYLVFDYVREASIIRLIRCPLLVRSYG